MIASLAALFFQLQFYLVQVNNSASVWPGAGDKRRWQGGSGGHWQPAELIPPRLVNLQARPLIFVAVSVAHRSLCAIVRRPLGHYSHQ